MNSMYPRSVPRSILFAGIAAWASFACPAIADAASAHPIANPCKLLTQAEISVALGMKFGAGELTHPGLPRCRFLTASQDEVFIDVVDPGMFDAYAHGATPMAGIGDKALWAHDRFSSDVYIVKGGNMVTLGLPRSVSRMTPALANLAKLVASRM
ncbi:MAG: hypothetical protein OJF55_000434 [Rhodanobacteraceae bacterium]|jgi:hypothetical protein|nr:MAG: hypothetical protein OJF55_000434 [Rhodanobacteraceae bacterium]